DEDEGEILSNGQKLKRVEPLGRKLDPNDDRCIDEVPNEVAQRNGKRSRTDVTGSGHLDKFSCPEDAFAKHAADRLGEAAGGVLRDRAWIREAAVPGWTAADGVRGKAVNDLYRSERRQRDEEKDQEAVVGAAALCDGHDRQPRFSGLRRHALGHER